MPVTLTINGQSTPVAHRAVVFDSAEQIGVQVPTSCHKNGKCKECIVEVVEGMELLSPRPSRKRTQGTTSPLLPVHTSPPTRPDRMPHDAPRADAHRAARLGPAAQQEKIRRSNRASRATAIASCSTARKSSVDRPDSRHRDGPRHDDHRPAPDQPGNRRTRRRRVVRKPAALRRIGRHVAHPVRHRPSGQAADAHAGRISHPRDRGFPGRSENDLRNGRRRQFDDARPVFPPECLLDRPERPTARSPKSKWKRASAPTPA